MTATPQATAPTATASRVEFGQVFDLSIWPYIEPLIAEAAAESGGRVTADDLFALVQSGQMQLWLGASDTVEFAVLTEIRQGRRKALRIICISGKLESALPFLPALEAWAREQGCDLIEAIGRKGFERVTGWHCSHVFLERELWTETPATR